MTMVALLYQYYIGCCQLSEVYMMEVIFQELVLLLSSLDWLLIY